MRKTSNLTLVREEMFLVLLRDVSKRVSSHSRTDSLNWSRPSDSHTVFKTHLTTTEYRYSERPSTVPF